MTIKGDGEFYAAFRKLSLCDDGTWGGAWGAQVNSMNIIKNE